ncbi:carbohydrate ABC transporter permease [Streptomyces sp. 3214.6]|uniref:carbohydrate ABC transporter permease n=1 Tax=Streptomyces sp. 3214.6 TaxID=1882757 RepID=UPI00090A2465|nr:sugar ABC transporter permease [Streptomyces sp. 3214.6]SHI55017.1 cellobiose transport system permease protein [Streptomyces sp. 3214.6]
MSSSPVAGPAPTGPTSGSDTGPTERPAPDRLHGPGRRAPRIRPVSAGARRGPGRRVARHWPQYLAISPYYLIFSVFMLFPVIYTVYLAFQKWDGIGDMHFVGFQQFRFLWDDPIFWLSIRNTLVIWVLSTVPMLFMALVLAVLVNSTKRLTAFYRVALFIPSITSLVAIAIFFGAIFSNNFGLINAILRALHVSAVPWLSNEWTIKLVIAALMTWQWTGYNAIIYLAGLQAIPSELYEAARMDGAGPVRIFFSITIPLLRPIILFTVVVSTVTGLQSFTEPQVLFNSDASTNPNSGGPGQAGMTTLLYFYHQAFDNNDFGYGAAIVWAFFLLILLIVLINWRLVQRKERRS